jgi:hypothetical protein
LNETHFCKLAKGQVDRMMRRNLNVLHLSLQSTISTKEKKRKEKKRKEKKRKEKKRKENKRKEKKRKEKKRKEKKRKEKKRKEKKRKEKKRKEKKSFSLQDFIKLFSMTFVPQFNKLERFIIIFANNLGAKQSSATLR